MLSPRGRAQPGSPCSGSEEFNFDPEQLLAEVDTIQQELKLANERCEKFQLLTEEIEMELREELALEMERQLQEQETMLQEQFHEQIEDINRHFGYLLFFQLSSPLTS